MAFTGIYELESFYKHKYINWIDCLDIKGTRGYCSEEAKAKIIKRIVSMESVTPEIGRAHV